MSACTVTAEEAMKSYGNSMFYDSLEPANRLCNQILAHPSWHFTSHSDLVACIFWAGRIQGIREERQRRKAKG